jgi:hypothetical protein
MQNLTELLLQQSQRGHHEMSIQGMEMKEIMVQTIEKRATATAINAS